MKLYYIIDSELPTQRANMVHVMKMCQAFANFGTEVVLLCNCNTKNIDEDAVRRQYGIQACFPICTVHIPNILQKHGHRLAAYYSAWLKSKKCLRDSQVYSRSAMSLLFLKRKIKYIYESHIEPDLINRVIERKILRRKNCCGLVVISNELRKKYMELFPFLTEDKITVLHDAADIVSEKDSAKAELYSNNSDVSIGYVGSLFPGKCMETILPLAQRCPQYYIHIVGGSEYWVNYWKREAEEKGINNLVFYGYVEHGKIGDYYRAFDICILPFSKNIYISANKRVDIGKWTSPLKLFEAMAYGKAIIVSGLETIKEVMTDRVDCVMVETDNIDDWEEKLTTLCEDKTYQGYIGQAALTKFKSNYTWDERVRRAIGLFK